MTAAKTLEKIRILFERDEVAEPEHVVFGPENRDGFVCPICKKIFLNESNFCPNCGQRWYGEGAHRDELRGLLSTRTHNALLNAGYRTLEELWEMEENELLDIPGIGQTGVREITYMLAKEYEE